MHFQNFSKSLKKTKVFFDFKTRFSQFRWPKFSQWKRVFEVLSKKEKIAFFIFSVLFLISAIFLISHLYLENTEIQPSFGGKYIEGLVGSPRFLNPIYATLSDADRDLVELIFSGLMKYDGQGKIVPDLAKDFQISEDGKIYEFQLKENAFWQDGKRLTADDIVFTIETIQNSDYKSPLRANWLGVEVEKISDFQIRFKLKNPYAPFLERLTLKILPHHIWQKIPAQNFTLSPFNLQPVGSGPYQFKNLKQAKSGKILSLDLERFKNYYSRPPFLDQISFLFFTKEEELINSFNKGEINGFSLSQIQNFNLIAKKDFQENCLSLPRYFALFFNADNSEFLEEKEVRKALNFATNKEEILEKILQGKGKIVESPILSQIYGIANPSKIYSYNPEIAEKLLIKKGFEKKDEKFVKVIKEEFIEFKSDLKEGSQGAEVKALQKCLSQDPKIYPEGEITGFFGPKTKRAVISFQEKYKKEILEPWGLKKGTGQVSKTTRLKLNEVCQKPKETLPLKFSLITVEDPQLEKVAQIIKEQWQKIGIETEIKTYPISQLKNDIIKPRDYQILLFGEVLEGIPDPFPFWHSSQKKDPGLNLAKYENKKVDKILEKARMTLDNKERAALFEEFQDILIEDCPAIFLYQPDFLYLLSPEIKGIETKFLADPSKRFSEIENWYIKTRRAWK